MNITKEITSDRQAIVTVEVDDEQMQKALVRAAQNISRLRPVAGFRPGKAPYQLVERAFGKEMIADEAIDELSRSLYPKVLKEVEIAPVDLGRLEVVQKEPPIFKYTIPVKPEIKLGEYQSIHLLPTPIEISDEEVNSVLERFQTTQATVVPVARAVRKGDTVTLDVKGGIAEMDPVDEKGLRVAIGDANQPHLPFEDQLVGMTAGETKEIDYTYPDDYSDEAFRSKTAHYSVTLHDIKETQLPELTDDFAKAVSQFESLDQFKGNIRDILRRQKERTEESRFADEVVDAIIDRSEIAFPPVMLEQELDHQVEHLKEDVKGLGLTWEKYLELSVKTEAEMRESVRPAAEKNLKRMLVIGELMDTENIQVSRDEVNGEIDRRVQLAEQAGANPNVARRNYTAKDARRNLEFNLRVSKTVAKIAAMAKGDPTSGKILTPDMVRESGGSPIPSGLITDPKQVRPREWPKGLE